MAAVKTCSLGTPCAAIGGFGHLLQAYCLLCIFFMYFVVNEPAAIEPFLEIFSVLFHDHNVYTCSNMVAELCSGQEQQVLQVGCERAGRLPVSFCEGHTGGTLYEVEFLAFKWTSCRATPVWVI